MDSAEISPYLNQNNLEKALFSVYLQMSMFYLLNC